MAMKILVFSDSHGNYDNLERAYEKEQPDVMLHLGDGEADFSRLKQHAQFTTACGVRGNCDMGSRCDLTKTVEYDGYRFFMTHGHSYQVKFGLMRLYYAAQEVQADVALYGHTHIPHCDREGGLWMMNPGTISGFPQATYGLIEITDGVLACRLCRLEDR